MPRFEGGSMDELELQGIALLFAKHDPGLGDVLVERVSAKRRRLLWKALEQGAERLEACREARAAIERHLSGQAKEVGLKYLDATKGWLADRENPKALPYPPQLVLQRLPELNSETLPDYLAALEDAVKNFYDGKIKLDELKNPKLNPGEMTDQKKVQLGARRNLEHQLEEYIKRGDRQALDVLVAALQKRNPQEHPYFGVDLYGSLFLHCLKKLKHNSNLIGALVNLMYEEIKREDPETRLTGRHALTLIIEGLKKEQIGAARSVETDEFTISQPGEPRDECHFSYHYVLQGTIGTMAILSQFTPKTWNEHQLVDPRKSAEFTALAPELEKERLLINEADFEAEMDKFRNDLKEKRRYGLDFARLKASEIPCPEGLEVWLHYFYDEDMPPGYIGVELVIENKETGKASSVVYILDEELNIKAPSELERESKTGRPFHPVRPENTGALDVIEMPNGDVKNENYPSVEHMYILEKEKLYDWTTKENHRLLTYYFAKYAHCLLVGKRKQDVEESRASSRQIVEPEPTTFSLSLEPYFTETTLPTGKSKGINKKTPKTEVVRIYHKIAGFTRRLPKGERASAAAIEYAKKAGVKLPPDYTWVRTHPEGNVFAQASHDLKKDKES